MKSYVWRIRKNSALSRVSLCGLATSLILKRFDPYLHRGATLHPLNGVKCGSLFLSED
jgi:hypothetical protein